MPEHFAFYSSAYESLPEENMRQLAGSAEFSIAEAEDGGRQFIYSWPNVQILCNEMPAEQLANHLQGFADWVMRIYQGQPDERGTTLLRRIHAIKLVVGIVVEPLRDEQGIAEELLGTLSNGLDAVMLFDGALYDKNVNLLLGPDGSFDEAAEIGDAGNDRVRAEVVLSPENTPATPVQIARYTRVAEKLRAHNVPMLSYALHVDDEEKTVLRTPQEIAQRVLVLSAVTLLADGGSREDAVKILDEHGLWPAVSPQERAVLEAPETDADLAHKFLWRLECIWVLMWALSDLEEMDWPGQMCDVPRLVALLQKRQAERNDTGPTQMRTATEILDAQQEILLLHWAIRDAWIHRQSIPEDLRWTGQSERVAVEQSQAVGVVTERHHALNWLTRFGDADWDDVDTPT